MRRRKVARVGRRNQRGLGQAEDAGKLTVTRGRRWCRRGGAAVANSPAACDGGRRPRWRSTAEFAGLEASREASFGEEELGRTAELQRWPTEHGEARSDRARRRPVGLGLGFVFCLGQRERKDEREGEEKDGHGVLDPYPCDAEQAGGGNRPRPWCHRAAPTVNKEDNKTPLKKNRFTERSNLL